MQFIDTARAELAFLSNFDVILIQSMWPLCQDEKGWANLIKVFEIYTWFSDWKCGVSIVVMIRLQYFSKKIPPKKRLGSSATSEVCES